MKNPTLLLLLVLPLALGCSKSPKDSEKPVHLATPVQEPPAAPSGTSGSAAPDTKPPAKPAEAAAGDAKVEGCVDKYLKDHHLNEYGDPEGTAYAGGTPLFDERTGKTTPRLDYVFSKQPDARKTCAP